MDIVNSLKKDSPLTNVQIDRYYTGNPSYHGCIFIGNLPDAAPILHGEFVIINLGNEKNGGTHWVLLFRKKNTYFYFDSFGTGIGRDILKHIRNMDGSLEYNTEDAQDINSNRCGFYCMYVADNLLQGRKFSGVVNDFSSDPSRENIDILLEHFTLVPY